MKKLNVILLFVVLTFFSYNCRSTVIKPHHNVKIKTMIDDWEDARGLKKQEKAFDLAEEMVKTAEAEPKFISRNVIGKFGHYDKVQYVIQIRKLMYSIVVLEDRRSLIQRWAMRSLLVFGGIVIGVVIVLL